MSIPCPESGRAVGRVISSMKRGSLCGVEAAQGWLVGAMEQK